MASSSLFLASPEREGERRIPPRLYGSPTCVPSPQQAPQAAAFAATIKEVGMFARHVTMRLKPNTVAEFTRTLENEVIPLLQKQKGFRDEIVLVVPGGTEAVGISFWDQKENADAYSRETYPEVQKLLAKVIEGTPRVQTYEVPTPPSTRSALAPPPEVNKNLRPPGRA